MKSSVLRYVLPIFLITILIFRLHLGFTRYFDSDEMSHMHWAWLVFHGKIMYRDFFFYNLPFFQWLLAPVFLLPADETLLVLARLWQFIFYIAALVLIFRLAKRLTGNTHTAMMTLIIFAVFPMTFDKTIEIRPDIQMTVFFLIGLDLILHTKIWTNLRMLILGLAITLSIFITFKNIFALPALIYAFLVLSPPKQIRQLIWLVVGLLLPVILYLITLISTGTFAQAYASITRDSFAVNIGKGHFSPWKALSPYPLVYMDVGGPTFPWYTNIAIWILSVLGFIAYIAKKPRTGMVIILYVGVALIFLFLFPAPYVQYFIPISFFASLLSAHFLFEMLAKLKKFRPNLPSWMILVPICLLLGILAYSFKLQYGIRSLPNNGNPEQLAVIRNVLAISKPDDTFYDMVGSYIFRPDAFYFCCFPYGEFIDAASVKVPPLRIMLDRNQTKFIILDRTGISLWITPPPDLAFIKSHYLASNYWKIYTVGVRFACLRGRCTQVDLEGNPVTGQPVNTLPIFIPETYRITTEPPGTIIKLNQQSYPNGPYRLDKGTFTLSADTMVSGITVQLDR
jgi:hypothetical protein